MLDERGFETPFLLADCWDARWTAKMLGELGGLREIGMARGFWGGFADFWGLYSGFCGPD